MSALDGRRVLITGASGRIGTVTTELLTSRGAKVTTLSSGPSEHLAADRVLVGDTTSEADVSRALEGVDLVVHLAALAHRDIAPAFQVYSTNVVSTFNVLAKAAEAGVPRAVVAGSINAYGLPQNIHEVIPPYFPLDTDVPADIADWYSLSKRNDEATARMVARHWGMDIVTLRFPHVNSAGALESVAAQLTDSPKTGLLEGWSYLDTRDAARSVANALTAQTTGAHAFFLAAERTLAPYRTEDLLDRFATGVPRYRRFVGREVPIDLTPARELIGFEARHEIELPILDLPADL